MGQYVVDYTFANVVTKRFLVNWCEGEIICVANLVNPTKFRFYVLVLLGSFICPVASGKFGGFKIFCSIGWFCIN